MAAGSTYTPIATTTLGSAQSSVTFSSSTGYTDLRLVASFSTTSNVADIALRYNSDTGSNYSDTSLVGTGSSATSGRNSNSSYAKIGYCGTSGQPMMSTADIMNYANTTTYKTALGRSSNAAGEVQQEENLWRNTAAITSVAILVAAGNFATGSTFTLYGIAAA